MPPLSDVISPNGQTIRSDFAAKLARCQELRTQAMATPISNEWDEMDMATYLAHLDETEASLTEELNEHRIRHSFPD